MEELELVGSVVLIAFWKMARIGERLREKQLKGALLRKHFKFVKKDRKKFARQHLRKAKTAKLEGVQVIHLQEQLNILDPVGALERVMLANKEADRDEILFATRGPGRKTPTSNSRFTKLVKKSGGRSSQSTWSGHSFKVGGVLLRYNLGTPMSKIARQGRWKLLMYLRYLKAYSQEEKEDTE